MSNTTTTLLPPHCVDPRSEAENAIVAVLGVLVIFISLHDFRTTYRSMYYAFDVRSTMTLMLLIPALYAMINIINVYISPVGTTILLMLDCQALIRMLYMFSLIKFTISVANAGNQQHGSFAAAVYHVGTFLERLQLKPLSLGGPPCCKIMWCKCSYIPGKAFLGQCVTRVYVALTLQGILMVVRQAMIDTAIEKQYSMLLTVWGQAVTFLALSAKMPLDALMHQILSPMPRQQFVAKWRNYQCQMWFVLIGALHNIAALIQNIAVPGCKWWFTHQHTIVAVELVIIVWMGHCAWVPPFQLVGCQSPAGPTGAEESLRALHITTGSLEKAKQELARSQLVLSEDDVQSVLNGDKTLKQARDDSATSIAVELKSPKGPATSERGMDLGWGILYGPPKLHTV